MVWDGALDVPYVFKQKGSPILGELAAQLTEGQESLLQREKVAATKELTNEVLIKHNVTNYSPKVSRNGTCDNLIGSD